MSSKNEKDQPVKKKNGMLLKIVFGTVLVAGGGGAVFGLMSFGLIGHGNETKKEANHPKLIFKGEEDPFAPQEEAGKETAMPEGAEGEGGSEYRTSYFTFTEDMTSNLKDSDSLVQISLAASTRRDGRVLLWLKKHELAIRSQLLVELANTSEEEVRTAEGKNRLQKRMTNVINKMLTQREGFGGVDNVYFRSLLVQ